MKKPHKKKADVFQDIAKKRIAELFAQAELMFKEDPSLSDRYVEIARNIGMKYKVSVPRHLKRRFCKHCYTYLVPGANCRVRVANRKIVYSCLKCRNFMRFPLN